MMEFMKQALLEAQKAFDKGEVPVGAVIVYNDQIIARAHNLVETEKSVQAHAELRALYEASKLLGNWRLNEMTLYVTLEPCPMCAGALLLSRIKKVVWGAREPRTGAAGSWCDLFALRHPFHQVESVGGVLEEESRELLQKFFKNRR
jgi:tRNA(adenine34) deaminase